MTLQEAIKHAKEVSSKECSECKKEHEQLAEWLEELKNIKDILGNNYDLNMLQEILNICDGKTPNQIKEIFEEWGHYLKFVGKMNAIEETVDSIYDDGKIDYDRLLELVEADKDGRCFISNVKLGGEIFYIPSFDGNPYLGIQKGHVQAISFTRAGKRIKIREYHNYNKDFMLGKNVFLNYEEAKNTINKGVTT